MAVLLIIDIFGNGLTVTIIVSLEEHFVVELVRINSYSVLADGFTKGCHLASG
jgi:hypothetical protein